MSNTHGEWLDRIRGHKRKNKSTGEWNLGDGLPNVVNSVRQKLRYAGFQLEDRERTILNVDSYEVTVLIWALSEYTEQKTVKRVVSRGGITILFSAACTNAAPGAEGGCWMNDTISRQAAIDAIDLTSWYHQNRDGEMVECANSQEHQAWYKAEDVYKVLNDLPSAQPERLTGKWEMCEDVDGVYGVCSICGQDADFSHYGKAYDFCPNCGSYNGGK